MASVGVAAPSWTCQPPSNAKRVPSSPTAAQSKARPVRLRVCVCRQHSTPHRKFIFGIRNSKLFSKLFLKIKCHAWQELICEQSMSLGLLQYMLADIIAAHLPGS